MKRLIIIITFLGLPYQAKADFWGGDLPLLAEIVTNTLNTMLELRRQSRQLEDELRGINRRLNRIKTISDLVQPSSWEQWKNPQEALRRLHTIYYTLPKEYRSQKSDSIEAELSRAMNMISRISHEAKTTFRSGKELESRSEYASPGVAQKLTASGVGTLISMEAQSQVLQSHITSLLTQILADANERESRTIANRGRSYSSLSINLKSRNRRFSDQVTSMGVR
ncbi:MAG: hypothetical protein KDD58_06705 [Bdellovibrionales bacterium]|nr:hypothetical protein [Bdellovibrionales bacterium]